MSSNEDPMIADAENQGDNLRNDANTIIISANQGTLNIDQLNDLIANMANNIQYREQLLDALENDTQQQYDITDAQAEEYSAELSYINSVENKIRLDKIQLNALKDLSAKRIRELQTTKYYKKYFNAWQKLSYETFLYVVINCILLLIAFFLKKGFTIPYLKYNLGGPESVEGNIFAIIPAVFLAYTVYHLYYLSRDYYRRDDNIFDEYNYGNSLATPTNETEEPEPEPEPVSNDCIIYDSTGMTEQQYNANVDIGCSFVCTDGVFSTTTYTCEPEPEPEPGTSDGFIGYMSKNMEGYMHEPEPAMEGFIGYVYEPEPEPEIDTSMACSGSCGTCGIEAFDNFSNNYKSVLIA